MCTVAAVSAVGSLLAGAGTAVAATKKPSTPQPPKPPAMRQEKKQPRIEDFSKRNAKGGAYGKQSTSLLTTKPSVASNSLLGQ